MKRRSAGSGKDVQFELSVQPGSRVFVAGTFNNWNPTANPLEDNPGSGHCRTTLSLPAGRHEYKFVVNGDWCMDPCCPDQVPNGQGAMNERTECLRGALLESSGAAYSS